MHDQSMAMEASRQYQLVLSQFQQRVSRFGQVGYSSRTDNHVAALAAAGFCCSQIEYIQESWSNGDQHLEGMASLLQACGPSCLNNTDSRGLFGDHCVLWISCSVTHRKQSIYSEWPWADNGWGDITGACRSTQRILRIASQLPTLLEQFDDSLDNDVELALFDAVRSLHSFILDLQHVLRDFEATGILEWEAPAQFWKSSSEADLGLRSLPTAIARGYASAYMIHATASAWEGMRLLSRDEMQLCNTSEDRLRQICEQHLERLRSYIEELSYGRHGLVTTSPMLFLLDSAWIGCTAVSDFCGYDLDEVKTWFRKYGNQVTGMGYRPLREPWSV